MNRETTTAADPLLEHRAFVTGLARALLGRDPRVEDVVQDAFVVAEERGHTRRGPMRAWLAGVVRTLVLTKRRRDPARRRRERRAARDVRLPSTDEVVAREQIRRRVLRAVLSLKEPYREVLLYRYYEELPPREIASATGLPVETVRTRIKRALALLRTRLDADHGGRRKAWAIALLPLAGLTAAPAAAAGAATTATSLGVLAMSTKTKLALGGLFLLLLFAGIWFAPRGDDGVGPIAPAPPVPGDDPEVARAIEPEPDTPAEPAVDTDDPLLAASRAAVKAALSGARAPDTRGPLPGRVTAEGSDEPVAGAKVTVRWDFARSGGRWPKGGVYEWTVVTDHRGEFRFDDLPTGQYRMVASHSDYASRGLSGIAVKPSGEDAALPLHLENDPSKLGTVAGVVLDPYGDAIEGAQVVVHTFEGMIRREGVTGPDGSYRVERLLPDHYRVSVVQTPEEGGSGRLWERTRSAAVRPGDVTRVDFRGSGTLTGIVLDREEKPVAGARVVLWPDGNESNTESRRGRTGEDGRFEIPDAGIGRRRLIVGIETGSAYGEEIDLSGSDREIEIRLGTGEIAGKVRLPDGRAPWTTGLFPGIVVFPLEGEKLGPVAATGGLDVSGAYRLQGLSPGPYRLRVHAKGYRRIAVDVTISRETPKVVKDFKLEALVIGTVRLTVTDPAGNAVTGIRMSYGEKGIVGRTVERDTPSPGVYVARMEVGSWVLVLYGDRLVTKIVDIEVTPDVETKLAVAMEWKD